MALVGVLFPVIFDGGDTFQAELESRIPPEPQFNLLPEPNPTRPVIIADTDIEAAEKVGVQSVKVCSKYTLTHWTRDFLLN